MDKFTKILKIYFTDTNEIIWLTPVPVKKPWRIWVSSPISFRVTLLTLGYLSTGEENLKNMDKFPNILQGYFTDTGEIIWLPR